MLAVENTYLLEALLSKLDSISDRLESIDDKLSSIESSTSSIDINTTCLDSSLDAIIGDKLRLDRSCQAGFRSWLKEKLVFITWMIRERCDNQFDIWLANSFDNSQILVLWSSEIFNWTIC
jgi:hypothetical protein